MTDEQNTPQGPQDPVPPTRSWWRVPQNLIGVALIVVAVAAAGGYIAYNKLKRPEDVSNTDVPFKAPPKKPKAHKKKTVNWTTFRYDHQRTGYLDVKGISPPFERVWRYGSQPLLEFPPIVVDGVLYFVDNDGHAIALSAKNGHKVWERRIASLNASTPTYYKGRLYIVNLEPGQILSLDAKTGKTIWKNELPCRSESSPLVVHGMVYFGCEDSALHAVTAKRGRPIWTTSVSGAIKGAPAYDNGTLFVGDYGGAMTAIQASSGEVKWSTQALGPGLGQAGSFYSTPAVAYGRVYAGNNDSRVYSFDEETGELAWTFSTGGYVYSGPTVAKAPGTPPTVYIGSFDGNVYALDAKSGDTRWSFDMGGSVIGSLSVIGRLVYAATFEGTTTYGLSTVDGRKAYEFHSGAYMPAISDGKLLYLVGYSSIHAMRPITKKELEAKRAAKNKAPSGKPSSGQKPKQKK